MREKIEYVEKVRTEGRTRLVAGLLAMGFLAYFSILWYHQVLQGDHYRVLAENNRVRIEEVSSYRGNVLDRQGRILVRNRLSFQVVLSPQKMQHAEPLEAFLAGTLSQPVRTIQARIETALSKAPGKPQILAEDVSLEQAVRIEARRLEWPELSIDVHSRRSYPEKSLAVHVLGYVGQISQREIQSGHFQADLYGGDIVGKTGIERVYEDELQGLKGFKRVVVNSRGRVVQELGMDRPPRHGQDIRLTLDLGLQQVLESSLEGKVGAAVFMDPSSGEILAMASSPAFEPNLFARRFPAGKWHDLVNDSLRPLQNRATLSHYSPGSTFKLVVAAAALEAGIITPSTTIYCPGYAVIFGHRFHCHKRSGHGLIDLNEALVHSCNVYFYNIGKTLGIERLAREARRLGLGEKTGVDLVFENAGLVPTPGWKLKARGEPWYPGETISVAIGEGPLSVTPLQMARLAAMLANGGVKIKPHLRLVNPVSQVLAKRPRVLRPATREALTRAMAEVVNRGTARRVALPGIQVAAKTGTAQFSSRSVGIDADRLPYEIRDHAWLIGFAPARAPAIAFAVFIEHGGHGGTVAAPVARQVLAHFFGLDAGEKAPPLLARTRVQRGAIGVAAP